MEKIRVNMTPCEDAKTIHASQNDNATRKWAFDLYDENGKIDSSSIKEQMIFDSRVGGTEQILPVNGSVPTTSPIIADIQYPDSLRSEQTFLYRESPTTEDGQAKITHIKGNTVKFNQLVNPSNFPSVESSFTNGVKVSAVDTTNGTVTITVDTGGATGVVVKYIQIPTIPKSHGRFLIGTPSGGGANKWGMNGYAPTSQGQGGVGLWDYGDGVVATSLSDTGFVGIVIFSGCPAGTYVFRPQIFDLTQMGIDSLTTTFEVKEWLSNNIGLLPYYNYTPGKLLPFKGESLKTTGFNQWDEDWESGRYNANGNKLADNTRIRCKNHIPIFGGVTYYFKSPADAGIRFFDANNVFLGTNYNITIKDNLFTAPTDARYLVFSVIDTPTYGNNICINFSSSENGKYEPYTSSTINLPTLTYFPTGMASVDDGTTNEVFDELATSKAITRVAKETITISSIYVRDNNPNCDYALFSVTESWAIAPTYGLYFKSDKGIVWRGTFSGSATNELSIYSTNEKKLAISVAKGATLSQAKALYDGSQFYYALATPTEEPIVTASLVTEKGETPLYYDDELIADCNETISSESGIFDAKIKLMTDETIYSQMIQLHVERKPQ